MTVFAVDQALRITDGFGTHECCTFRAHIFRSHEFICLALAQHYRRITLTDGHVKANESLRKIHETLKLGKSFEGLLMTSPDEDVRRFAEHKAKILKAAFFLENKAGRYRNGLKKTIKAVENCQLTFPHPDPLQASHEEIMPALARVFCPDWWRRGIRTLQDTYLEAVHIQIGMVHKRAGIYASNHGVNRKLAQWKRNEAVLAALEAENELGEVFNLLDVAKRSVANLVNRRNELMTRMAGFEAISKKQGHTGVFLTLTAPSKYHSHRTNDGQPNPAYTGSTPADTQAYLNRQWAKIRAKLNRIGVKPYGFRVVEPHHDGCPHWHMLLFLPPEQVKDTLSIFRHYALEVDGNEPGAQKRRFTVKHIDSNKGTAAGYIAKYIAKNIDGENVGADLYGHDAIESAVRIRAWASTWKIRQFQQIGGPSVTAWRESRRLAHSEHAEAALDSIDSELLEGLIEAADKGDWETFTELSGGPTPERASLPLRALHVVKKSLNKYGQEAQKLIGLLFQAKSRVITRFHEWTVRLVAEFESCGAEARAIGGANAPPLEFCQ
ncbi:replication endonuclease [Microbulbifer sp. YPW1]|uniref:replication endonuclease n=1 Tax=Microbulbifer sp. YPW1 TaxID=2745199 RepID=UPI001599C5EB|nr:replication endonuclease [Microbulbifer sp. YPW1]QKX18588.1 replication endonuclease [Microbulbifer sp. YPW1]